MPTPKSPRKGSLAFWPRSRAKRIFPTVGAWAESKEAKALGFAGYKVGMAHVILPDNRKNSLTKNEQIAVPVTIVECPPLKVIGARFYTHDAYGFHAAKEFIVSFPKDLELTLPKPKKLDPKVLDSVKPEEFAKTVLIVATQPRMTTIGKKKPEVFEIAFGAKDWGKMKELIGKDLPVDQVFKEGELVDIHAVTKGKGIQGPTKRFGLNLRNHKSEKTRRGPGSLGPWHPAKVSFRVPHLGQMGYQTRTDFNKQILKIAKPEEIVTKKGFKHYGVVKNTCVLIKGSVGGVPKRLIRFNVGIRQNPKLKELVPQVNNIVTKS